jgi:peptidoglycan/xylan/chitin deacetylase (PgdA/CDA1 family)
MPHKNQKPVGGVMIPQPLVHLSVLLLTGSFLGITAYLLIEARRLQTPKPPLTPVVRGLSTFPLTATTLTENLLPRSPWPTLHPQATKAKVPILMYHDILPEKEVFFDVTPEELERDFKKIALAGATPINFDELLQHLQTGSPLPEKPVLLTFDDGYGGHYEYVYPLLKKYNYPAVFSIYTDKMKMTTGRSSVTWEQLQEMAADPLVTILSHTVSHPPDLRQLSDSALEKELIQSKQILEARLGIPIPYFTYPAGKHDQRVRDAVAQAGYQAALEMSNHNEHFAGDSEDLLQIGRFGQSRLEAVLPEAWGGHPLPRQDGGYNFNTPIRKSSHEVGRHTVTLITGGRPQTILADSRYQVQEIIQNTQAVAAVDGAFFSLKYLDSNVLIGPSLTNKGQDFSPGNPSENPQLEGRPLVLIAYDRAKFVPFDPNQHDKRDVLSEELPGVTDAFVGAAWLVKDNQPQSHSSFKDLYGFDAYRFRAFWGINQAGQPVVGVSQTRLDSVTLGQVLHEVGLREAVMLDSGASTSLVYRGESLMGFTPRPVPHVVALYPPQLFRTTEQSRY